MVLPLHKDGTGRGGRVSRYSISFECVGDFPRVPWLINESAARNRAVDYCGPALQINLFDSGPKKKTPPKPVDSVSSGLAGAETACHGRSRTTMLPGCF